mmetsp:Transcript_64377/g.184911  ORF Transcript_64377/g.184911 Transcript_64377/m.184911 type:complete len:384 (+) Transcript_64377:3-1154(+)
MMTTDIRLCTAQSGWRPAIPSSTILGMLLALALLEGIRLLEGRLEVNGLRLRQCRGLIHEVVLIIVFILVLPLVLGACLLLHGPRDADRLQTSHRRGHAQGLVGRDPGLGLRGLHRRRLCVLILELVVVAVGDVGRHLVGARLLLVLDHFLWGRCLRLRLLCLWCGCICRHRRSLLGSGCLNFAGGRRVFLLRRRCLLILLRVEGLVVALVVGGAVVVRRRRRVVRPKLGGHHDGLLRGWLGGAVRGGFCSRRRVVRRLLLCLPRRGLGARQGLLGLDGRRLLDCLGRGLRLLALGLAPGRSPLRRRRLRDEVVLNDDVILGRSGVEQHALANLAGLGLGRLPRLRIVGIRNGGRPDQTLGVRRALVVEDLTPALRLLSRCGP